MSSRSSRSAAALIVVVAALSCEPGARFLGPAFVGSPSARSAAAPGTLEVWVTANPPGQAPTLLTRIQPDTMMVDYGATVRLEARVVNSAGATIPSAITYSVGNPAVATVSATGEVTGVGYGKTTVTAWSGSLSQVVPVSVGATPAASTQGAIFGVAISSNGVVYAIANRSPNVPGTLYRSNLPSIAFADGNVSVGQDPHDVVFNSAGTKAYVAYGIGTNSGVGVFDVPTNAEVTHVPLPTPTFRVTLSPDNQKLYAAAVLGSEVHVIDPATNTVTRTIPLSAQPVTFAWGPDASRLYVLTGDLTTQTGHFAAITEINTSTDTPIRTFPIGGKSLAFAVSPDGTRLYVAKFSPRSLEVWNLTTGSGIASVPLLDESFDMQLTPDGSRIWVSQVYSGKVLIFNSQNLQLEATIRASGEPYRIAWDPRGSTAAISNQFSAVSFAQTGPFPSPAGDPRLRVGITVGDTVRPWPQVAAFTVVIPKGIVLDAQASVRLNGNLANPAGWVFATPATYSTTTPSIVQVNSSGVVTGLRGGVGSVTVSIGSQTTTLSVTVYGQPAPQLSATTALPSGTFGTAVSSQGVFMATRPAAGIVVRGTLPNTAVESNIPVGSVPTSVAFNSTGATAYVTNQGSQTLSIVDVATGAQLAQLRLDRSSASTPAGAPGVRDGALAAHDTVDGAERPLKVDRSAGSSVQASSVPFSGNPFAVTVSPDDGKVYVGIVTSNVVHVVDPSIPAVVRTITLGGVAPTYFAWSPDGTRLYVNSTTSGVITEIDATTDVVLRTFSTGGRPQGMAVSRDGAELYVADENRQMLDVWQLSNVTRIASTPLAAGGLELQLTPNNAQLWISLKTTGRVAIIDRASRQILQTVTTTGRPRQIAFDRYGTTAVVANDQANVIHFIR
jgi:YVTN family beta-propeller protein